MRLMPEQEVMGAKPHRCAFCGAAIPAGERHLLFRAFDPDRWSVRGAKWGAWVSERWHSACRRRAPAPAKTEWKRWGHPDVFVIDGDEYWCVTRHGDVQRCVAYVYDRESVGFNICDKGTGITPVWVMPVTASAMSPSAPR